MKYAVGENVMSCIQAAESDKATKISVTERNDNELQCVGILLTSITLEGTDTGCSRSHNICERMFKPVLNTVHPYCK